MNKNFDAWNNQKKNIEDSGRDCLVYKEGEIWWCSLGVNIGDEEDGKNQSYERPVLIVKKFNARISWVLPMTSKCKEGKYYYSIAYKGVFYTVILSQLRLASMKRFRRKIRRISSGQLQYVKELLAKLLTE